MKQNKFHPGRLSISRMTPGDQVRIELVDESSGTHFIDLHISLEGFGRVITGQGYVECDFLMRGTELVGMIAENKTELVKVDGFPFGDKELLASARAAIAQYEVDGWKARGDDVVNSHRYKKGRGIGDGESKYIECVFFRHVPAPEDTCSS